MSTTAVRLLLQHLATFLLSLVAVLVASHILERFPFLSLIDCVVLLSCAVLLGGAFVILADIWKQAAREDEDARRRAHRAH